MSNVLIQNNEAGPHGYGIAGGVYINSNSSLNMSDSTITGNTNDNNGEQGKMYHGYGAGIYNAGTLNLTGNVTISNNIAPGDGKGGGIYNSGSLVMNGGTIQNNQSGGVGGGLYLVNGKITGGSAGIDADAEERVVRHLARLPRR